MANACEHSIADRENTPSRIDLARSQVAPEPHVVAQCARLDPVIEYGEGDSRELRPRVTRAAAAWTRLASCSARSLAIEAVFEWGIARVNR
jgi:hypothetical protein